MFSRLSQAGQLTITDTARTIPIVRFVLYLMIGTVLVQITARMITGGGLVGWILLIITLAAGVLLLLLLHRGYARLTARLLCAFMWGLVTTAVFALPYMVGVLYGAYLIVTLLTGLLLSFGAALITAIASLAAGLIFIMVGISVNPNPVNDLFAWISLIGYLIMTIIIIYLANRVNAEYLHERAQSESQLAQRNADLEREMHERQALEAARIAAEINYRHLIDTAPVTVIIYHEDGQLVYVNTAGIDLLEIGEPLDQAPLSIWDFLKPEDHARARNRMGMTREDSPNPANEYRIITRSGRAVDIQTRSIRVNYANAPAMLTIINDMTEVKRAQEEHHRTYNMRLELEREKRVLALKQDFINTVSHEFRTPLTIILSSRDLLDHYADRMPAEKQTVHLGRIAEQVHHMVGMLDGILTVNKASAGMLEFQPTPLLLPAFCRDVLADIAAHDPRARYIRFMQEGAWDQKVIADGHALRAILTNLISNALKFSDEAETIELALACDGDVFTLTLTDRGIGVPFDEQARVFEPFYRARNAIEYPGTGLGLSIAQNLAVAQNGVIVLSSSEGQGSHFEVRLPLVYAAT